MSPVTIHSPELRLSCVTGRFQPVHRQHLELFELALERSDHLIVAVTNPDMLARRQEATSAHRHSPDANPFTYFERVQLLARALRSAGHSDRTTIVPFDLTRPQVWAEYVPKRAHHLVRAYSEWERQKAGWFGNAGYRVTVLEGDPAARISSTDIRAGLGAAPPVDSAEEAWWQLVPESTIPLLQSMRAACAPSGGAL